MQPSPGPKGSDLRSEISNLRFSDCAPINRKAPARKNWGFSSAMCSTLNRRMEHGRSDRFSSRKLECEPGGERLHAVTLDVVAVPHRKGDRHGHPCLELHIVRIACFQCPLHDNAPGRAAIAAALDGTGRLPYAVADHVLM